MGVPAPLLSVVVPVHRGVAYLRESLQALRNSDLPAEEWELIVVDDASPDASAEAAARWADQVIRLSGRPHGPGYARNRGVERSRGAWIVFIDADVAVHSDTLSRLVRIIREEPEVDAIFGAYDDHPPVPGFLSQYRNLLHRYVHLSGAGEVETFWAGCGAVRRGDFLNAGGFNEARPPRHIEDVELGYRLRERGARIVLRPEIEATHLRRWTWLGSLRTDVLDRGLPWVRLLFERRRLTRPGNLNLRRGERFKAVLVGAAFPLLVLGAALAKPALLAAAGIAALVVVLANLPLYRWFARRRGTWFALAVIPMNLWYYLLGDFCVALGGMLYLLGRDPQVAAEGQGQPLQADR